MILEKMSKVSGGNEMKKEFVGTLTLLRLAIRRDRIKLSVWLFSIAILVTAVTAAMSDFLPTQEEIVKQVIIRAESPAMRVFDAPASGASVGAFTMMRGSILIAVLTVLMSMQTVIRHTRQNEETGRAELIASTAVGKYASVTAALTVVVFANLLLSILIALAMISNGLPVQGALAAGSAFAGVGITFSAVAAITSQLSQSTRGATGLGTVMLGFAFLLSSIGNVLGEFNRNTFKVESASIVRFTPWGWFQQVHAFHENNWWILALFIAAFFCLVLVAFYLIHHRDVGMGILPARRGPAFASKSLLSPVGLAWRLQRGLIFGWLIAMAVFGTLIGAISNEIKEMISVTENAQLAELLGGTSAMITTIVASFIAFLGSFIAIYFVLALLRLRHEESDGYVEAILAAAVSRTKWLMSHVICTFFGGVSILFVLAFGASLTAGRTTGDTKEMLLALLEATFLQGPAILVLGSFVIFLIGIFPKGAVSISIAAVVFSLIAGPMFGTMLNLPEFIQNISPFTHTQVGSVQWSSIISLLMIATFFTIFGIKAFSRRNLSF